MNCRAEYPREVVYPCGEENRNETGGTAYLCGGIVLEDNDLEREVYDVILLVLDARNLRGRWWYNSCLLDKTDQLGEERICHNMDMKVTTGLDPWNKERFRVHVPVPSTIKR